MYLKKVEIDVTTWKKEICRGYGQEYFKCKILGFGQLATYNMVTVWALEAHKRLEMTTL